MIGHVPILARLRPYSGSSRSRNRFSRSVIRAFSLSDDLLVTSVPDHPYLARELSQYFPHEVRDKFPDSVKHHRLRREVISTNLANAVINRGGQETDLVLLVRGSDHLGLRLLLMVDGVDKVGD
jgi:NAD-specific glutamate dehydrogenase